MAFERAQAQVFGFTTLLATDHVTPTVPTNPVATVSKDGGAFGAAANAVTSVASGYCTLTLTGAEMTADTGCIRVTSDNCDPVHIEFYTEPGYTATRAALLDYLDAAISGREASGAAAAAVAGLNDLSAAEVNAEVDTALAEYDAPTKAELDSGLAGLSVPTAGQVADAVWDETLSAHNTAGSTGAKLADVDTLGAGADAVTLTVKLDGGTVVGNADVWISTSSTGSPLVASGTTNSSGQITFYLDAGVTYYCWREKVGYNFDNPTSFVAVAD